MIPIGRERSQGLARAVVWGSALTTLVLLFLIVAHIVTEGLPHITTEFLLGLPRRMGREGGILPAIVGTLALSGLAIAIATPLGVGTAIYLTEYTREGRVTRLIRFGTESLAGVPSIIFGLFGFVFFVITLGLGWSILSGGLTLAAMILPIPFKTEIRWHYELRESQHDEAALLQRARERRDAFRAELPPPASEDEVEASEAGGANDPR